MSFVEYVYETSIPMPALFFREEKSTRKRV